MIPFPKEIFGNIRRSAVELRGRWKDAKRRKALSHNEAGRHLFPSGQDIAEDDCLLFLWATFPNLDVALETIRRWGFQYKTAAFVWVKRNRKSPSWFWGLGNWTRANAEICLLATKGKPKRASASVHSIIDAPIGRHSEKPAETRDRIAQLAGGDQ